MAVNLEPPMATSAPWKAATTSTPIVQLEANPAAMKKTSGRRGWGDLSNTSSAARLVAGRRPLSNPSASASMFMARCSSGHLRRIACE